MIPKCSDTLRTALFAGSFNPFTYGHLDILRRALALFDRVVVCVGYNIEKQSQQDADVFKRVECIKSVIGNNERVDVMAYGGLTVDAARRCGAVALLRGVRSVSDFDYEMRMADVNKRISGIDTVLLPASPELACISSSVVRELRSYGFDALGMVPGENELNIDI